MSNAKSCQWPARMRGWGRLFVAGDVFPPSLLTSPPAAPVEVTAMLEASQSEGASLEARGP